jgi:hypothetical protein
MENPMESQMIPDSVLRLEAVQSATATSPDGEEMSDFMRRVNTIYAFLSHTVQPAEITPHGVCRH